MLTTSCGSSARKLLNRPATRPLWIAFGDQRAGRRREAVDVAARFVEHLHLESAEDRQPLNRRRRKRHDHAARNAKQLSADAIEHGVERLLRALALCPVLSARENHAAVGRGAGEAEARSPRRHRAISGSANMICFGLLARSLVVYSSDAPDGACTIVMK